MENASTVASQDTEQWNAGVNQDQEIITINNYYYNNNNNNYKRSPVATTQRVAPTPQQPPVNSSQL